MPNNSSGLRKLRQSLARVHAERVRFEILEEAFRNIIAYYEEGHEDELELLTPGEELRDNIALVLNAQGSPMHPNAIHTRLRERGYPVPGRIPVNNVRAHMSGDKKRFVPVGDGLWGLKAWPQVHANSDSSAPPSDHIQEPAFKFAIGDTVQVLDNSDVPERYRGLDGEVHAHDKEIDKGEGVWRWVHFDDLDPAKIYPVNEAWLELVKRGLNLEDLPS